MSKATGKLFAKGNYKLDKSVGIFSLPPVITCVNCATCKNTCYARQQFNQYTSTRRAWTYNHELSKTKEFYFKACEQLQQKGSKDIIRLHSSGDFYDNEYIDKWYNIIKDNPNKMFYTYTKNYANAKRLNELPNCNVINSFIHGYRNYGTTEYCELLKQKFGAYVCTLDVHKDMKCMRDCKVCLTHDKVAIVIHGNKRKQDDYESKVIEKLRALPDYVG